MDEKELLKERFKTAVSSAVKAIAEKFDIEISLADERAMSQRTSPFRSASTLMNYAETLISEQISDLNEE